MGNSYGRSALSLAAMKGHVEVVEELLNKGVPLDLVDTWGLSAFRWAQKREHPEIADRIMAAGAKVGGRASWSSPSLVEGLGWTCCHGGTVRGDKAPIVPMVAKSR